MYIPIWLIVIIAIIVYFVYRVKKQSGSLESLEEKTILNSETTVEEVEERVQFQKERIFELEHFDSPQFIDVQDAFDAMDNDLSSMSSQVQSELQYYESCDQQMQGLISDMETQWADTEQVMVNNEITA